MSSQYRDFSAFSLFTAGLAYFAPLASAYTQPTGNAPVGNAFSAPGLNSVVPVGQPYTVTWTPSTDGTVTLVLLKGPSSDAEPQYAIVEKIPNSGTYTWTPASDLFPSADATGYGIELIDDATGQYQYTTQFGISNPGYSNSNAAAGGAAAANTTSSASPSASITTSASLAAATTTTTETDGSKSSTETLVLASSTVSGHHESITGSAPYPTMSAGAGRNGTVNTPTGGITVLTSTKTGSATGSATPSSTANAAVNVMGSFGAVAVAAGLAVLCA